MNYYPFHIGDFRSGTVNMSRQSRWIYRDMLDVYYDTEQPLTLDMDALCDEIGAESDEERKIVERLLRFKFEKTEDGYRHEICEKTIAEYRAKAEIAKANGKLGGRPKKDKATEEKPSGFQSGSDRVATTNRIETLSQTNQEPRTNNHKPIIKENNKKKKEELDFYDVPEKIIDDFQKLRNQKKAAITQTAINRLKAQSDKAGISLADGLALCCTRGWVGFEADWITKNVAGNNSGAWWASDSSILAKGAELGINSQPGESTPAFKARIQAAIDNGGKPPPVKRNLTNTIIPSESRSHKPINIPELKSFLKNRDPPC